MTEFDKVKKELKELDKKIAELQGKIGNLPVVENLTKEFEDIKAKLSEEDLTKQEQAQLLNELKVKLEEVNYLKQGYKFIDGKWVAPEKVEVKSEPSKVEPEKDETWFL